MSKPDFINIVDALDCKMSSQIPIAELNDKVISHNRVFRVKNLYNFI